MRVQFVEQRRFEVPVSGKAVRRYDHGVGRRLTTSAAGSWVVLVPAWLHPMQSCSSPRRNH